MSMRRLVGIFVLLATGATIGACTVLSGVSEYTAGDCTAGCVGAAGRDATAAMDGPVSDSTPRTDVTGADGATPTIEAAPADDGNDEASLAGDGATEGGEGGAGGEGGGGDAGEGGLETGLVAFYTFSETTGTTTADSSGHNNTATMNAATFAAGLSGNAATMNGSTRYVTLPAGIVSTLTSFSIATWVNLNSTSLWSRVFDFGTGTTKYMFFTTNAGSNLVRFAITTGGNGAEEQINGPTLATGSWQHVAITLSGSTGTLYVNGQKVAENTSMTLNPSSLGSTDQNWLGRSQFTGDNYLSGQIDDFRIYGRALSAAEVQALFAGQL